MLGPSRKVSKSYNIGRTNPDKSRSPTSTTILRRPPDVKFVQDAFADFILAPYYYSNPA